MKFYESFRPYLTQFIAVFTGSLALVSNGMEYGWASPALPILFTNSSPISPPPEATPENINQVSNLISSLYLFGGVCGLPITFTAVSQLGRRRTILTMAATGLLCWILVATARTLEQLYAARFIAGLAANAMYCTLPMYNGECSQPKVRGFFGSIVYVMSMIGVLISYIIIPFIPIWVSSLLPICLNCIMLTSFYFQPETPYYLIKCSKPEEAKKSLQHFRTNDITEELNDITAAVARQESERGRPWDLVLIASNRKATLIMLLLNTAQNMAGISVIVMNAQYLLEEAARLGNTKSPVPEEWAAIIFSSVMLAASILGSSCIDKYGRRFLLLSSGSLSAIFLAILAIYYAQTDLFVNANLTWVPLFAMIGYASSFRWGLGLVPIVVNGELFPSSIKAFGMVCSDLYFTVIATLSLQVYYSTAVQFGLYVPFIIFSSCATVTTFLIWIYVPETKGRTLEEIQMILKKQTQRTNSYKF